ncbi:inhibitor of KinA sporulation pathway (predicted exonuclease) [Bradyrhizobium sp. USDA 4341]
MNLRLRTDVALVLDVEETCWDGPPPPGMSPEIIEIGVAELDVRELVILREASFLVRPMRSEVSAYCTALTGHTAESLRLVGRPIAEVLRTFSKNFGPSKKVLMSWGDDWKELARDAELAGVANPFPREAFQNIGQMLTLMSGSRTRLGLAAALEAAGLSFDGVRHRGVDDARNTAKLYAHYARGFRELFPVPEIERDLSIPGGL